jgi:hypothetical protein
MHAKQHGPILDLRLPTRRVSLGEPSPFEGGRKPTRCVTYRLAQIGGQRTRRHDRTYAGHHNRDGRQKVATQFPKPATQPRVFDFRAWRPADDPRQLHLVIVRARDNRKIGAVYPEVPHGACGSRRGGAVGKERENQGMRHGIYSKPLAGGSEAPPLAGMIARPDESTTIGLCRALFLVVQCSNCSANDRTCPVRA